MDQGGFFTGKQAKSNRESLITCIGEDIVAVRWRQYRLYPKQFVPSARQPGDGWPRQLPHGGGGYPAIFNVEADPREEINIVARTAWVIGPYLRLIGEYQKSLEKYPNPRAVNLTEFGK